LTTGVATKEMVEALCQEIGEYEKDESGYYI
jgi:hypothetical protein